MTLSKALFAVVCVAFASGAQARDFFNCPIYPVAPEPPPLDKKDPPKKPPHQKSHEETFQETKGSGYGGANVLDAKVSWQSYIDEAQRAAKEKDRAFVIYFCDPIVGRVAGEGREAWDKFRKENNGAPTPTVFDSNVMLRAFEAAGIVEFVKIADTPGNQDAFKKYEASRNMLVFCAPDGDRLAVFPGQNLTQTNVVHFLENNLARYVSEWRKAVKAEEDRAAAEKKSKDEREARVAAIRANQAANQSAPKARPGDAAVAEALPKIEQRLANLDACAKAGWSVIKDKEKKDIHPIREAGALYTLINDLGTADGVSGQPGAFLEGLYESQTRATALLAALKTWAKAGAPDEGLEKINGEHKRLASACEKLKKR
ncbi:MAG TPA: hypothetical protein VEJ63_13180 [Planctomycetota bacterium]|nr:hypothetical protein [Planctomycetota bacterium]